MIIVDNNESGRFLNDIDASFADLCQKKDSLSFGSIRIENLSVDIQSLKQNLDFYKYLVSHVVITNIICEDYESLVYINSLYDKKSNLHYHLSDDFKCQDRSYIHLDELDKLKVSIPSSYAMWNVPVKDEIATMNYVLLLNGIHRAYSLGNENWTMKRDTLERLKELALQLKSECIDDNSIQKNVVVSNYLQRYVQYVDDIESESLSGVYVIEVEDSKHDIPLHNGYIETVLNHHNGVCAAIANTTMLLLNNPIMHENVHSVFGNFHVWNVVQIGSKYYYVDNTWSISRNKNKMPNALKAIKFTNEYLFFGQRKANELGHHIPESYQPYPVEQHDLGLEVIQQQVRKLHLPASYDEPLAYPSHKK